MNVLGDVFERVEGRVRVYLEWRADDGEQPARRLYWLCKDPPNEAWFTDLEEEIFEHWFSMAVPSDFPGGDKRIWRQTTRYALVRVRNEPAALGVNSPLLPEIAWSRVVA